jgi:hypothetical protein
MRNGDHEKVLSWILECYGSETRDVSRGILSDTSSSDLGPLDVVSRAQHALFKEEIELATACNEIAFDSDFEGDVE